MRYPFPEDGSAAAEGAVARNVRMGLVAILAELEQVGTQGRLRLVTRRGEGPFDFVLCGGRLCFVAGPTGEPRLGDILRLEAPDQAWEFESALTEAYRRDRPLGEVLAAMGPEALAHVRRGLRGQIARALVAVARRDLEGAHRAWVPLDGAFESTLTFPAREILTAASGRLSEPKDDLPEFLYRAVPEASGLVALFRREMGALMPVKARGMEGIGVGELARLGELLKPLIRPPGVMAAGARPQWVTLTVGGRRWVLVAGDTEVVAFGGCCKSCQAKVIGLAAAWSRGELRTVSPGGRDAFQGRQLH